MNTNKYMLVAAAMLFCLCRSVWAERNAGTSGEHTGMVCRLADKGYRITVRAGLNIGGTAPLPVPSEVKSINRYNPGMNPIVGATVEKIFGKHWGTQVGLHWEKKGMETDVTVENYHTKLVRDGDQITGNYTGKETTSVNSTSLTVPLLACCRLNKRWMVNLGPYFSYVLKREFTGTAADGYMRTLNTDPLTGQQVPIGSRIEIPANKPATYDFSSDMRRFQWGIEAGVDWQCFKHFMLFAHLDWGMNDIFKNSFEETVAFSMYPIYGTLGFGYTF